MSQEVVTLQKAVTSQKVVTSQKAVTLQKAVMLQKMVMSQKTVILHKVVIWPRTNQQEQRDETKMKKRRRWNSWCDAGMYSGMTITMYFNYAHMAQQYFLLHFTKYVVLTRNQSKQD